MAVLTRRAQVACVLGLLVGLAVLAIGSSAAAAQGAGTGIVRIEVRYPNGSLVTNADVCSEVRVAAYGRRGGAQYTNAEFTSVTDQLVTASGAISQIRVPAGQNYVALAYNCDTPGSSFRTAYHFTAEPWHGTIGTNNLALNAVPVSPDATTTFTVTVGRGEVTGSFPGLNACAVEALGVADDSDGVERAFGKAGAASAIATTYQLLVPPGSYRIRAQCGGQFLYHPQGATYETASLVRVGQGGRVSGVNFSMPTGGSNLSSRVVVVDDPSINDGFCLDTMLASGARFARQIVPEAQRSDGVNRAWARIPLDSQYRIKIADCFGRGFADNWYPGVATSEEATLLGGPNDNSGTLPTVMDVFGGGGANCNGQRPTILGNAGANMLTGTAGVDVIAGAGGNDTITGLGGDDILCGGDGNDRIFGNAGLDWIDAGAGNDWVGAGWGDDTVFGGAGDDFIRGFKHNDWVDGGTGNDRITGGWGNDVLRGGAGNDVLRAYYGADQLFGDAGNDVLLGGFGPDFLVGGPGPLDRLFGQEGTKDVCNDVGVDAMFSGCETINGN